MIVKTHLYKNGDECTSITGGFKDWDYGSGGNYSRVNIVKNSDHILMKPNASNKRCTFITNNKINLTKYKNLVFELELVNEKDSNEWGGFGIIVDNTKYEYKTTNNTFSPRVVINISSETGEFYIGNHIICGGYAESPFIEYKIKEIYLEEEVQGIDSDVLSEILDFGEVTLSSIGELKVKLYDSLKEKDVNVTEDDNMTTLVDTVATIQKEQHNLPKWANTFVRINGMNLPTALDFAGGAFDKENGIFYVAGGFPGSSSNAENKLYIYDLNSNKIIKHVNMPAVASERTCAFCNGKLYIFNDVDTHIYDPSSGTWEDVTALPSEASRTKSVVKDNLIYILGGGRYNRAINKNQVFSTVTKTVTEKATVIPSYDNGCVLMGEVIYYFAGIKSNQNPTGSYSGDNNIVIYDTKTNTVTKKYIRLSESRGPSGGVVPKGDKIYIMGGTTGWNSDSSSNNVDLFDTKLETMTLTEYSTGAQCLGVAWDSVDGMIIRAGGTNTLGLGGYNVPYIEIIYV